jgi:hypothetical protein
MKYLAVVLAILLLSASVALVADQKQLPNQAGNDALDVQGTVLMAPADIRQALGGNDLAGPGVDPGTIVVRLKVIPKSPKAIRVGPADFTLLSRKDGQRSPALAPNQVAGGGSVLVVRAAANQPGGDGTTAGGPVWGGVSTRKVSPSSDGAAPAVKQGDSAGSPIMAVLAQYILPDKEIKTPVEGLLYFSIDHKLKPKDLSLIYDGEGGKLVVDFK